MMIRFVVSSILIIASSVFADIKLQENVELTPEEYVNESLRDWDALLRLNAMQSSANLRSLGRKCHQQMHPQASKWRKDQYRSLRNVFPAFTDSNFRS
ncbi:unnamed protein product, partial [Protopolystoma xenopodis]